jgi:hypothetical protein
MNTKSFPNGQVAFHSRDGDRVVTPKVQPSKAAHAPGSTPC